MRKRGDGKACGESIANEHENENENEKEIEWKLTDFGHLCT